MFSYCCYCWRFCLFCVNVVVLFQVIARICLPRLLFSNNKTHNCRVRSRFVYLVVSKGVHWCFAVYNKSHQRLCFLGWRCRDSSRGENGDAHSRCWADASIRCTWPFAFVVVIPSAGATFSFLFLFFFFLLLFFLLFLFFIFQVLYSPLLESEMEKLSQFFVAQQDRPRQSSSSS